MKKLFAAGAALAALAAISPAAAADMVLKAPPPDPPWSWSGFYLGANVGYSAGSSNSTLSLYDATTGAALDSASNRFALDGVIGGGQIGYNWQRDRWVFGLEGDIQASGQDGSLGIVCAGGTGLPPLPAGDNGVCARGNPDPTVLGAAVTDNLSEKLDWFGTIRGRLGSTITPTALLYVTGGLAIGGIKATDTVSGANVSISGVVTPVSAIFTSDTTKAGWTVGGGLEARLWGNWTGKIEYLYINLGSISGSFVTPIVAPSRNFLGASFNSTITDNIMRVGINYHF